MDKEFQIMNEPLMGMNEPPQRNRVFQGECREPFHSQVLQAIKETKSRLEALEKLEKIASELPVGSPLETFLWDKLGCKL